MTREEAKKRLEAFRDYLCAGNPIWDVDECREAFNTAIRSLEAWEKVKNDLNDDFPEQTKGFRYGIDYAMVIIDKHLKEVEE